MLIIFLLQIAVCLWFGHTKQTFCADEVYSYGLANSEEYTFLDPRDDEWFRADFFKNYVTTSPQKIFQIKQAYINQVKDVHPPLYYYILHVVSSFSGDIFTKWTGIGLNLFLLIFADILLYYIAREFLKSPPKAIFALILWSFSASGISNILYIRMYFLLTVFILSYIALHIKFAKNDYKLSLIDCELLFLNIVLGGLTHYYFYVFAFIYTFLILIFFLIKHSYKLYIYYICSILFGLLVNYIHFPAVIEHIFKGYRGTEVISNMFGIARTNVYAEYFNYINNSLGGGYIFLIIITLISIIIFKKIKFSNNIINLEINFQYSKTTMSYLITVITSALFCYIVIQGSELISNRYIYCIYPIFAILISNLIFYTLSFIDISKIFRYLISFYLILFMCITSININGIDFQFRDFKITRFIIDSVRGYDYLIYKNNFWIDTYSAIEEFSKFDEFRFFNENDLNKIKFILSERNTDNPLIVVFPNYLSIEEKEEMVKTISKNSKYKHYNKLCDLDIFLRTVYVIQ